MGSVAVGKSCKKKSNSFKGHRNSHTHFLEISHSLVSLFQLENLFVALKKTNPFESIDNTNIKTHVTTCISSKLNFAFPYKFAAIAFLVASALGKFT